MTKKYDILYRHIIEGESKKSIAINLGISRNTVKKYIHEFKSQKKAILAGGDRNAIMLAMTEDVKYDTSSRKSKKVTDEVNSLLEGFVLENARKKTVGNHKLCMKRVDMYEALVNMGYDVSYPTITWAIRKLVSSKKEAFIKQEYSPGEVCEFDWGDVKLEIKGIPYLFKLAIFTLSYSNFRYAKLFRNEDTQSFQDSHISFFSMINGVPQTMVYDNMRVAVSILGTEKKPTLALKQMATYYGFSFRFCNVASGNEKGHVERSVEVVRRKAFSFSNKFDSIEEANNRLMDVLDKLNQEKSELYAEEIARLLPKMPDYSSVIRKNAMIDKFSTFSHKNRHYSVPDYLVGKEIELRVFSTEIHAYFKGEVVAKHEITLEEKSYSLQISHYHQTLLKKPGAIKNSSCLKQSELELQEIFTKYFENNPREFILLLEELTSHTLEDIKCAIELLKTSGANIQLDSIKMMLSIEEKKAISMSNEIEKACEAQLKSYSEVA